MKVYSDFAPTYPDRADWTLPAVLSRRAKTHGDSVWLDVPSSGATYTFFDTWQIAQRVASGLLARGHQQGDRLVIMMPNCEEYLFAWVGSATAGMVEVPINTAYHGTFFEHQVSTVEPTGVILAAEFADRFVESRDACSDVQRLYLTGTIDEVSAASAILSDVGYEVEPFAALMSSSVGELPIVKSSDLASVFFTSGTTGLSKGVMMPHAHMFMFADETVSLTKLTDEDTYLSMGPLFHGNSQFLAAYPALIAGARYVMRERFSASRWATWVQESRATVTNFVGVMMDFVWSQPPSPIDQENDLRCVFAAPTALYAEEFKQRFGVEAFVEVFGLTETAMPIMTPYGMERPHGAAGLVVDDWFEIRLVDPETDEEVAVGDVGELIVRSKRPFTTCAGYFNMAEKTVEVTRNCWFHTGDGLRRDEDGWYYFVDRLKDAIRRRGENISSFEVEQAVLEHPAIEECAVVGVAADQDAGEDEVMVFVVLAESKTAFDVASFWEFADRHLPYFAVPRYVQQIEELPKTPSEKVRKAELRTLGTTSAFDRAVFAP
jgi:crotonobetaine/carnitine-CoA ligase